MLFVKRPAEIAGYNHGARPPSHIPSEDLTMRRIIYPVAMSLDMIAAL